MVVTDLSEPDNAIVFANPAFEALTGYETREVIGRNARFLQGPGTDLQVTSQIEDAMSAGRPIRREILNYRKNGEPFWNDMTIDPIRDEKGAIVGFVCIQFDSTANHEARDAHAEAEIQLQNIFRHVPGYVYRRVLRSGGGVEIRYLSPSLNPVLGVPDNEIATEADFYRCLPSDYLERMIAASKRSAADLSVYDEEICLVSQDGSSHWFRSHSEPRRLANGDTVWDGLAIDITAEKIAEAERAFLSSHDPLTKLPNRIKFREALLKAMDAPLPEENRIGMFIIDIDAFQEVNESLGHGAGDAVLRAVGERVLAFAESSGGTAARIGGDEFAVMLPAVPTSASVTNFAAFLLDDLTQPVGLPDREIVLQACIGGAIFPYPADSAEAATEDRCAEFMQRAELALHAAKQQGPGTVRVYVPGLDDRFRDRMALRQSLARAVADGQFDLHYQPLVDLVTGRIVGAEALIRWLHPELGLQRPDLFIPLAEASGLIVPLGAWAMKEAMRQKQAWTRQGIETPRIAINVSSIQLQKPDFIAMVERSLAETGATPKDFEIEMTETVLAEASSDMLSTIGALKSLGFDIVIDDFGTGHSTFRYLRDFPIDKIKIDQTFVRQLVIGSSDATIIRAMIGLARSLGIKIVAEGVETAMQRDFLRDEGCEVGQGYLFSTPMVAEDFGWMLQKGMILPSLGELAATGV